MKNPDKIEQINEVEKPNTSYTPKNFFGTLNPSKDSKQYKSQNLIDTISKQSKYAKDKLISTPNIVKIPLPKFQKQADTRSLWKNWFDKEYVANPKAIRTYRTYDLHNQNVEVNLIDHKVPKQFIGKDKIDCYRTNQCLGVIEKFPDTWYGQCSANDCKAIQIFFEPNYLQEHFITNVADKILLSLGTFGSGKTTASAIKVFEHMLNVPRALVIAFAQTLGQLEKVGKEEFLKCVHPSLIDKNNKEETVLTNGSKILWYASDKESKFRGMNITYAWVIEANDVKLDVIWQLENRIRSSSAIVYEKNPDGSYKLEENSHGVLKRKVLKEYSQIILESNPDPQSATLQYYWKRGKRFVASTNVHDPRNYKNYLEKVPEDAFKVVVYLSSSLDNPAPSESFIANSRNMKGTAYDIFVNINLAINEGLVYQKWEEAICNDFEIPEHWPRIFASDFGGGTAPTAMIAGAIDPNTQVTYLYDYYQAVDAAVFPHVEHFQRLIYGGQKAIAPPWPIEAILGDPSGARRTEGSLESVFEQYKRYGIPFIGAKNSKGGKSSNSVKFDGITITNDLMANNMLKILNNYKMEIVIKQLSSLRYEYKMAKGSESSTILEKIEVGGRDEAADCTRYIAVHLASISDVISRLGNKTTAANYYQNLNQQNRMQSVGNRVIINAGNNVSQGIEKVTTNGATRIYIAKKG